MKDQLVYIHGFLSSNQSDRIAALREYIELKSLSVELHAPQLPDNPQPAYESIRDILETTIKIGAERGSHVALIGHSMGGYMATKLAGDYQLRCVLINPVVRGYEIMCEFFGDCHNEHTGADFSIGEQDIDYLIGLNVSEIKNKERLLVLQQMGDDVVEAQEVLSHYANCQHIIEPGGSHNFDGFERHVPEVLNFLFGKRC